jgi:hypothetical protein
MAVETLSTARTSISPVVIYWWVRVDLQILFVLFLAWLHTYIFLVRWIQSHVYKFCDLSEPCQPHREVNMFHNNFMAALSSHTSNRIQPLDLAVYGLLTLYLSQEMNKHLKFGIQKRKK